MQWHLWRDLRKLLGGTSSKSAELSRFSAVFVEAMADELLEISGASLAREVEMHRFTPIGLFIGEKLEQLRGDLMHPLQVQQHSRQARAVSFF